MKLDLTDAGKTIAVKLGASLEITLTSIGPGEYGPPQSSSAALQFEGMHLASVQVPAGPTEIFVFRCQSKGSVLVTIPHTGGLPGGDAGAVPFSVTIVCG